MRRFQNERDEQEEEWNDERGEAGVFRQLSTSALLRRSGRRMESEEERERKKKKEKEKGRVVASLRYDRAPKGSRVVRVVCVDEHGKKKWLCHCRVVSLCTRVREGAGQGPLLIAGFPFLPERTGLFEWAGGWGSSAPEENAVPHQSIWPVSLHTPHC